MRISGHLCVYIQAVAAIAHQNLVLLRKKKLLQYLYFKSVREPLVHEDSNIDHGGALFEAKEQKITFILDEEKRCASSKIL